MFQIVFLLFLLAICLFFVLGLVLIGEARRKRPDFPSCRNCEYNLSGLASRSSKCPECGVTLKRGMIRQPREPFINTLMLVGGIVMVIASLPMCCIGNAVIQSFW